MFQNHKIALLSVSHFGVICLAWAVAKNTASRPDQGFETPLRTKSPSRSSRSTATGDDAALLAEFRQEQSNQPPRFQELAETLPPVADMQAAVAAAVESWLELGTPEEMAENRAVLEARVLQWMRQDPGQAMDYLTKALPSAAQTANLINLLGSQVFPIIVEENGLVNSLDWLTTSQVSLNWVIPTLAAREIKSGGGLALFVKLEQEIGEQIASRTKAGTNPTWRDFYQSVGKALRFEERDRLLEYVGQQTDAKKQQQLLLGFAQSGEAATSWLLDLIARGELDEGLAGPLRGGLGNEVYSKSGLDMDVRVQARRATKGNETKDRQSIINELVGGDVNRLLVGGRDWRYEFRTGVSSLDEVMSAVREGLPGLPAEGEEAMHISLYRHLAEEDPAKALPLLDELPEEKRREVLFGTTWQAFTNNDPEIYLRFLNSLPEPVTEQEKAERIKGWDWKARGCLARYGDDYVEWVRQLPPGLDKERAMNSLVWATREQDPAKARELSEILYPKNP